MLPLCDTNYSNQIMKQNIFNQYVDAIVSTFDINKCELFSKQKLREITDARYLLYYLCHTRPMRIVYIQKCMSENGYEICHSTIIHGINTVKNKIQSDRDYLQLVKKLNKSIQ